jgi:hypothetical protein
MPVAEHVQRFYTVAGVVYLVAQLLQRTQSKVTYLIIILDKQDGLAPLL